MEKSGNICQISLKIVIYSSKIVKFAHFKPQITLREPVYLKNILSLHQ